MNKHVKILLTLKSLDLHSYLVPVLLPMRQ